MECPPCGGWVCVNPNQRPPRKRDSSARSRFNRSSNIFAKSRCHLACFNNPSLRVSFAARAYSTAFCKRLSRLCVHTLQSVSSVRARVRSSATLLITFQLGFELFDSS